MNHCDLSPSFVAGVEHRCAIAAMLALALTLTSSASAQTPLGSAFTYQGALNIGGAPYTGTADFTFALFDDAGGDFQIGSTLAANAVVVTNGVFTASLDFGTLAFNGDERWLEIEVHTPGNGGLGPFTTLSPRQLLTPTPYAQFALNIANPSPFVASGSNAVFTGGNVGIGTNAPTQPLHVSNGLFATLLLDRIGGSQLTASAQGSVASIGTQNNFPFRILTNNAVRMSFDTAGNVGIGTTAPDGKLDVRQAAAADIFNLYDGGTNVVTVIDGGSVGIGATTPTQRLQVTGNIKASGWIGSDAIHPVDLFVNNQRAMRFEAASTTLPPAIFGPVPNVIGGYSGNSVLAELDNTPLIAGGVIGGGGFSGEPNRVTDHFGFIGGGAGNLIGSDGGSPTNARFIVLAGGLDNTADDFGAALVGGENNRASGVWSFMGGGENNHASATRAALVGGLNNLASGSFSFIGGGEANIASGLYAVVPGGLSNQATELSSHAAGRRAIAQHQGAFVWGDSTNADFVSTANNQFLLRANGGVGINTNAPAATLHVAGDAIFNNGIKPGNTAQTMVIGSNTIQAPASMNVTAAQNLTLNSAATMTIDSDASMSVVASSTLSIQGAVVSIAGLNTLGIGGSNGGFMLGVNGTAGKPGGGSWSALSDARLKTNIQPLHDSLDRLLALRGVTFEYRNPDMPLCDDRVHTGMIAQEVERVFPEWIDDNPNGYKTLTFRGFEALTVEALRELRQEKDQEIAALREEIAARDSVLADTIERLNALERRLQRRGADS